MSGSIAWINDHWGQPRDLNIPLSDRGLQLADGVFETVLVHNGHPQLSIPTSHAGALVLKYWAWPRPLQPTVWSP